METIVPPTQAVQETTPIEPMAADKAAGKAAGETSSPVPKTPQMSGVAPIPSKPQSQSGAGMRLGIIAGILVVLAIAAFFLLHHRSTTESPSAESAAALATDSYVEVIAQPWATVKSLTGADGKVIAVNEPTPVRVQLAAGEYTITLVGPNSQEHTDQLSVGPDKPAQYSYVFEAVDAAKIVSAY
jgi:hypothetical protein